MGGISSRKLKSSQEGGDKAKWRWYASMEEAGVKASERADIQQGKECSFQGKSWGKSTSGYIYKAKTFFGTVLFILWKLPLIA